MLLIFSSKNSCFLEQMSTRKKRQLNIKTLKHKRCGVKSKKKKRVNVLRSDTNQVRSSTFHTPITSSGGKKQKEKFFSLRDKLNYILRKKFLFKKMNKICKRLQFFISFEVYSHSDNNISSNILFLRKTLLKSYSGNFCNDVSNGSGFTLKLSSFLLFYLCTINDCVFFFLLPFLHSFFYSICQTR